MRADQAVSLYPDHQEQPESSFDVLLREAFDAGWDSRCQRGAWQVNEGYARRKEWAAYRRGLGSRNGSS